MSGARALVALSFLTAACPHRSPTPAPPRTAAAVAPADDGSAARRAVATAFVEAWSRLDSAAGRRDFDPQMLEKVPPERLAQIWKTLERQNGKLATWRLEGVSEAGGNDRYAFDLGYARRHVRGLVVVSPSTTKIVGFFITAAQATAAALPQPARDDPRIVEQVITIESAGLTLPAVITRPASASEGPWPAVLLVAGSGPQDRDETVGAWHPFRDLAHGLAHQGVVSLRYDKRTFAHPDSFDSTTATVEEEVILDAVTALARLRQVPGVDGQRLFILGHSLGALLAPEIAERAGDIAGLILVGAPGRPAPNLVLEQMRVAGVSPAELEAMRKKVASLERLAPQEPVLGAPAFYWRDLIARDEIDRTRRLRRPVLLIRGELDHNVFEEDQASWSRALGTAHVPVRAVTLPGLNHLLIDGRAQPNGVPPAHVPESVSGLIASFIARPPQI